MRIAWREGAKGMVGDGEKATQASIWSEMAEELGEDEWDKIDLQAYSVLFGADVAWLFRCAFFGDAWLRWTGEIVD